MKLNLLTLLFACSTISSVYSVSNQKADSDYHTLATNVTRHKNEEMRTFKDQHSTRLDNIAQSTNNERKQIDRAAKLKIDAARTIRDPRERNSTIKQINREAAQAYREISARRKSKTADSLKLLNQQLTASAKRHNDQLIDLKKRHTKAKPAKRLAPVTNTTSTLSTTNRASKKYKKTSKTSKPTAPKVAPNNTPASSRSVRNTSSQRAFSNFTTIKTS